MIVSECDQLGAVCGADSPRKAFGGVECRRGEGMMPRRPCRARSYEIAAVRGDHCELRRGSGRRAAEFRPWTQNPSFKKAATYRTAIGSIMANQGDTRVRLEIEGMDVRVMTFQVADVTKPSASAGPITARGILWRARENGGRISSGLA